MWSIKANSGKPSLRHKTSIFLTYKKRLCPFYQSDLKEIVPFCQFSPPRTCIISQKTTMPSAFCKTKRIYFIQIYIRIRYSISIWSFDTN